MAASAQQTVTRILNAAGQDPRRAVDELLPLLYAELRSLAHRQMAAETPAQTLQPTALVHEAYMRLVGSQNSTWESRGHFFAAAARAMRQLLIERARKRAALKHGGGQQKLTLDAIGPLSAEPSSERILALDDALCRLEAADPRKARIVMLRYFTGLSVEETAQALSVSSATVKREWRFAKAWLYGEMSNDVQ